MGTVTNSGSTIKGSWEDCNEQETRGRRPEEVVSLRLAKSSKGSGNTEDAVGR